MFSWKDEFSVKIKDIDMQHKRLFEIGDKIYDIANLNDQYDHYDEIVEILDELRDYAGFHFDFEEKLLEKYGYDQLETQQYEHMFFVKKIGKLSGKDIENQQRETALDIAKFVTDWISSHILKSDMRYKEFLLQKGVG